MTLKPRTPWEVNLLCLDLTDNFVTTLWATSAFLNTFELLYGPREVELVGSVATQDSDEITTALYTSSDILHLMSHARSDGAVSGKRSLLKVIEWSKRYFSEDLVNFIYESGEYPDVECLLFDACETASRTWLTMLRRVVPSGQTLTLLGTTRQVGVDETLVYTLAFYQCLLAKPKALSREVRFGQYQAAHDFAAGAFKQVTRKKCPFVLKIVKGAKSRQ